MKVKIEFSAIVNDFIEIDDGIIETIKMDDGANNGYLIDYEVLADLLEQKLTEKGYILVTNVTGHSVYGVFSEDDSECYVEY